MEDKLLLLQMAFSLVSDSPEFQFEPINHRIEMVIRVYEQFLGLMGSEVKGGVQ